MIGIIATIIAVRKRHYTFAWVIGIWTGIAIFLALSGNMGIAIGPGALFLFIAIGMKKIPEEGSTVVQSSNTDASQAAFSAQTNSSAPSAVSPVFSSGQSEELITIENASSAPVAIRFCRYCGQELEAGARFCRHCGARLE